MMANYKFIPHFGAIKDWLKKTCFTKCLYPILTKQVRIESLKDNH